MTLLGVPGVLVLGDMQGLEGGQVLDNGQVPGLCPYPVKYTKGYPINYS